MQSQTDDLIPLQAAAAAVTLITRGLDIRLGAGPAPPHRGQGNVHVQCLWLKVYSCGRWVLGLD